MEWPLARHSPGHVCDDNDGMDAMEKEHTALAQQSMVRSIDRCAVPGYTRGSQNKELMHGLHPTSAGSQDEAIPHSRQRAAAFVCQLAGRCLIYV